MIQIGQVYRDKDKRMSGRHVRVEFYKNSGRWACVPCAKSGRIIALHYTNISAVTLEKRFELVKDVE